MFLFCFFTDELSMNPRVRSSPYSPPPADELILSKKDVFNTRRRRLFFLSIHLLALAGLYLCVTCQVKLYTVLFGKTFVSDPTKCLTFPDVSFAIKRLELVPFVFPKRPTKTFLNNAFTILKSVIHFLTKDYINWPNPSFVSVLVFR